MALAIMAVGNGYGDDTPQVMATLADTQDWPLYPLLHRALHPASDGFCTTGFAVNARARAMLDELPANGEPMCPGAAGPAPHGFTTHNRFIRGKSQAYVGPDGCDAIRYHGLDYMLLHNLYAIATPGTWNGSPDADPCAPIAMPDGSPTTGDDAGASEPGTDGGTDPQAPPAGCACGTSAPPSWPILLAMVLAGRRRRCLRASADRRRG